ncbi:MAG: hypothetical protein RL139_178 [Gemmatimonadota bacterium]|jgi:two-component system, cell cycle sensor histidine kinase and response regulator CckA
MNGESVHKLLQRQLRRHFGSLEAIPGELVPFLTAVEMAYRQSDADRELLERSVDTVSRELEGRLQALRETIGERDEVLHALSLLEAAIEGSDYAVLIEDLAGRVVQANALCPVFWPTAAEALARRDANAVWAGIAASVMDPAALTALRAEAVRGAQDLSVRTTEGRTLEVTAHPQRLAGETVGWVWRFRDVTDRHLLEEQVRQSQKMEAVGQLAGGVAHDFNNLLTIIRGNVDLVLADPTLSADGMELLGEVARAGTRAADLTRQLLAFGRKQTLRISSFDLGETVVDLESMLRRLLGASITLETSRGEEPVFVKADRGQLDQVVMNLVLNARDAMPGGGTVRVGTRCAVVGAPRAVALGDILPAGVYAELTVSDTGSGIAPADLARIFEPFYTTKPVGQGTGLGLAMVHGIVRQSHGFIDVESAHGRGTVMRIFLPVVGAPAPEAAERPVRTTPTGDTPQTILVAEDEAAVRRLIRTLLHREGYTILEAANGREALEVIARHPGPIHLVVSDVVMPELGGPAMSRELRQSHPSLPVLFISGYSNHELVDEASGPSARSRFLGKPFTTEALTAAVREVLDTRATGPRGA